MATNNREQDYRAFGDAIKAHREQQGWSLRQAAKAIGIVSYGRLRDFERAIDPHSGLPTRPTEDQVFRIAQAYKADRRTLLRLAGYSGIGPLDEWEEELVLTSRQLTSELRARLLDLITKLPRESKG